MTRMLLWLPALSAIIVTAMGLTAAGLPASALRDRRVWMAGILLSGCCTIAASVWLTKRGGEEVAAIAGTSAAPQASPAEPGVAGLTFRIKVLEDRVKELEAGGQARSIPQQTADDFGAYLKQFGSRRVIVSCVPNDMEAYRYANQLVNILRAAGWDAQGPQVTKIFGDVRSPGVNLYVNGENTSDTVKLLLDGFAKFNVPYQARVTPSGAIPDAETVELFVGTRTSGRINAGGD
jgi:hypothetical protein